MTTAVISMLRVIPQADSNAARIKAVRVHYNARIIKRLDHSPYEVASPIIRLVLFCRHHRIALDEIESGLSYNQLLQFLLEGYRARFNEVQLSHLGRTINRLQRVLNCNTEIHDCDRLLKVITMIQDGKNREYCRHSIRNWRDTFARGESII